jgi:hypothetical protein
MSPLRPEDNSQANLVLECLKAPILPIKTTYFVPEIISKPKKELIHSIESERKNLKG